MTPDRKAVIKANRMLRDGRLPKPRRLDSGETALRIPDADFAVLIRLYPELNSKDGKARYAAWKKFAASPAAEPYRVMRSPRQVRAHNHRIIVK